MAEPNQELDVLLQKTRSGDRVAYDRVFAIAYSELRGLARAARRRLSGATLNTTGLVHECYLRLLKAPPLANDAAHFLAIAAQAMRHLLIELARGRLTQKRGANPDTLDIDDVDALEEHDARELIEIDDLLRKLAQREPQQAAVTECRFFGGLSDSETAQALGLSIRTVQREWTRAREWMAAQ